jgi:hypothetical protein
MGTLYLEPMGGLHVDQERSNKIIAALNSKGATKSCPRCGHLHFNVLAETTIPVNNDPTVFAITSDLIPTAIVACSNCGFLTQHALGALGLVSEEVAHAG